MSDSFRPQSLFTFQTEDRMREAGQREDRDAEALRYGKALCKFVFTSFYLRRIRLFAAVEKIAWIVNIGRKARLNWMKRTPAAGCTYVRVFLWRNGISQSTRILEIYVQCICCV